MSARGPSSIDLPTIGDSQGDLTFAEAERQVPHPIRRVFHLHRVPADAVRGNHAHRTLHETLLAITGSFSLTVFDGETTSRFVLDSPKRAVHVPPMHWVELRDFAPGTCCLVLASDVYDEADYVRDLDAFVELARRAR